MKKLQLKKYYHRVPRYLKNKYAVTLLIFLVWMLFFDQNNFISQIRLHMELNNLQQQKDYYETKIKEINATKQELLEDPEKLEKFAREKYRMKKADEELFIVED